MSEKVIELKDLSKDYITLNKKIEVLKKVNYKFSKNKLYAIQGHSGSGKTTLVKILGLMVKPTSGDYFLYEQKVNSLTDDEESSYRLNHIGFIFQEYNLNPYLTAFENVSIPLVINKKIPRSKRKEHINSLLKKVGLEDRETHFPKELSGGEQQRVAIARALANNPDIIIADEPTGNLDKENEKIVFNLLKELSKEGKCVIVVSHSLEILKYADIHLLMENGILSEVKDDI